MSCKIHIYRKHNYIGHPLAYILNIEGRESHLINDGNEITIETDESEFNIQILSPIGRTKSSKTIIETENKSDVFLICKYNFKTNFILLNQFEQFQKYSLKINEVSKEEYLNEVSKDYSYSKIIEPSHLIKSLLTIDFLISALLAITGIYLWNRIQIPDWVSLAVFLSGFFSLINLGFNFSKKQMRSVLIQKNRWIEGKAFVLLITSMYLFNFRYIFTSFVLIALVYIIMYFKMKNAVEY
jgi:hypothetical protein